MKILSIALAIAGLLHVTSAQPECGPDPPGPWSACCEHACLYCACPPCDEDSCVYNRILFTCCAEAKFVEKTVLRDGKNRTVWFNKDADKEVQFLSEEDFAKLSGLLELPQF